MCLDKSTPPEKTKEEALLSKDETKEVNDLVSQIFSGWAQPDSKENLKTDKDDKVPKRLLE